MVARRDHAKLPSLCIRCDGACDGAASRPPLRFRQLPQLSLVLLDIGRDTAVARLRLGDQRLHAAVGCDRPVRHRRHGRVARLAAFLQRRARTQLHHTRRGQRSAVLAPVVRAHRAAARRAGAAVDTHATRSRCEDAAAATDRNRRDAGARCTVAREAGALRTARESRCGADDPIARLVLSRRISIVLRVVAGRGVGRGRRAHARLHPAAVAAAQAGRARTICISWCDRTTGSSRRDPARRSSKPRCARTSRSPTNAATAAAACANARSSTGR